MQYRTLGKSGIKVSEIGVGGHQTMELASALDPGHAATRRTHLNGQIPAMPDADRATLIDCALDLGVNYFDTSLDPLSRSQRLNEAGQENPNSSAICFFGAPCCNI